MPDRPEAAITTLLFTDLVNSTELIQQVGDEQAQRVFAAHHGTLVDCLGAHGGEELQWEGDGLMAAFASAGDAVRCAVAIQQAVFQPVLGHQLELRAGLNAGEILRQEIGSGHFGTPVVVASRLCDRAQAGQILASSLVAGLLAGRQAFRFQDLGPAELKGIEAPVAVAEVVYEVERALPFTGKMPFVGRGDELARLGGALEQAATGSGGLVLAVGDPGIGKTRTLEEFAAQARSRGARVLWGRCYEGEGARPFSPFAEALEEYWKRANPVELRKDLGPYGAAIEAIAPSLRARLPDLPELPRLEPDEERTRLFDALTQFLLATSQRSPVVLVLDDLHWADGATIVLLRYVARFAGKGRLLLLGAYRDVELDRQHPLADALATLKREVEYERIPLKGLAPAQVGELLEAIAAREVPGAFAEAMSAETEGNPFFIREIVLHLVEEGKLYRAEGRWASDLSIEELGIPEGVRQVIGRRLSRLSGDANALLRIASGFEGAFPFEVVATMGELDELAALDALDEALEAQLLRPSRETESYEFTHALIRHTLYAELNPSRQVRLHRRLAEEMERRFGAAGRHAAGIARHYHLSAALPGAEQGVHACLRAAEAARSAGAVAKSASLLRMALDLLPDDDTRRPRILAQLALDLGGTLATDEAIQEALEAGEQIARAESADAAANYLADAFATVWQSSFSPAAWQLAEEGLRYVGERRDLTWARLMAGSLDREASEDPELPGMPLETPTRREVARVFLEHWREIEWSSWTNTQHLGHVPRAEREEMGFPHHWVYAQADGDLRGAARVAEDRAREFLKGGRIAMAAVHLGAAAGDRLFLGEVSQAEALHERATELASKLDPTPYLAFNMAVFPISRAFVEADDLEALARLLRSTLAQAREGTLWALAPATGAAAWVHASLGDREGALRSIEQVIPAIERAPGGVNYTTMISLVCLALFELRVESGMDLIRRNLEAKVLAEDIRCSQMDGRLAMALLSSLQGGDEDPRWFADARRVLDESGGRPLRALVDFYDAWAQIRRGEATRARPVIESALARFREIGMPGWIRRAEALLSGKAPTA